MTALPPGRSGLPLLGETLDFARNGFQFVADRLAEHGPVFRTSLLGRRAVVMSGPEAVTAFIDPANIRREGAMPPHVQEIFGGRSLPLLDGDVHLGRKKTILQAFTRAALTAYLPEMQRIAETYARQWASGSGIRWVDEMQRLALEMICANVAGITDRAELDQLGRDYPVLANAFGGLPINIPGLPYWKAMRARDRIFTTFRRHIAARRQAPRDDGLSRLLATRQPDGTALADHEVLLELHHLVAAGYIVFAEFVVSVLELARNPGLLGRLQEEVRHVAGAGPVTIERIAAMPTLGRVVMEVKRVCPILPAVFGIARRDFSFGGTTIPEGWMVMWALRGTHLDPATYREAERFDPDRFASGREEHKRHEHAFVPQGGGPYTGHKCPGIDYATYAMSTLLIVLLRDFEWTLPAQNLEFDWSRTPPVPTDGLRAVVRRSGPA